MESKDSNKIPKSDKESEVSYKIDVFRKKLMEKEDIVLKKDKIIEALNRTVQSMERSIKRKVTCIFELEKKLNELKESSKVSLTNGVTELKYSYNNSYFLLKRVETKLFWFDVSIEEFEKEKCFFN